VDATDKPAEVEVVIEGNEDQSVPLAAIKTWIRKPPNG
jgi:hypothetical protein